jgi:hypothetical protein
MPDVRSPLQACGKSERSGKDLVAVGLRRSQLTSSNASGFRVVMEAVRNGGGNRQEEGRAQRKGRVR